MSTVQIGNPEEAELLREAELAIPVEVAGVVDRVAGVSRPWTDPSPGEAEVSRRFRAKNAQ